LHTVPHGADDALVLAQIFKRFGSTVALHDVSLRVRRGTVHVLLGENGAGKTTLMHIAFGMMRPDAGTIFVRGRACDARSPADAIRLGIGMVHQHFTLVPAMTVVENLALGGHGLLRPHVTSAAIRDLAHHTGFPLDPAARIESLSVGVQQRVEIAKALVRQATLLILDEPTAVLAPNESEELLRWLRQYVIAGNSVVLITHKLTEALSVADDVTVLRNGRVVQTGPVAAASIASLTEAMIGESPPRIDSSAPAAPVSSLGLVVFRAQHLTVHDEQGRPRLRDASFVIRGGELIGVAGIEGAGHRELLRALAGRRQPASGTLEHPSGVGFVPEDRHRDAVLLDRSLVENVALRAAGSRRGLLRWADVRNWTESLIRSFDVRVSDAATPMRALSGGNQQKLVVARELAETFDEQATRLAELPSAVVVENPTRGLDVHATLEVQARLRAARDRGAAVVVYSSDLDEVLTLASRIFVMHAGTLREVAPDRVVVGRAMLGFGEPEDS
jgi:simple sugar transport system ATP-binding protein